MAMVEREFRMKRDTGGRNDKGNQVLEIRENTSVIQREHIIKKKTKTGRTPYNQGQEPIVCALGSSELPTGFELPSIHTLKRFPRTS